MNVPTEGMVLLVLMILMNARVTRATIQEYARIQMDHITVTAQMAGLVPTVIKVLV